MPTRATTPELKDGFFDGQLLLAMPGMSDERFVRTVIYVCAHSSDGAMGIIVNKPAPNVSFRELLLQLDVVPDTDRIQLDRRLNEMRVLRGGPVETGRGFVLHSADFAIENSTLNIDNGIALTATVDILKAIAAGGGPTNALLALGYAGWAPGQLETEMQANGWLNCPADPGLVFDSALNTKYERALALVGIDLGMLSSDVGHA